MGNHISVLVCCGDRDWTPQLAHWPAAHHHDNTLIYIFRNDIARNPTVYTNDGESLNCFPFLEGGISPPVFVLKISSCLLRSFFGALWGLIRWCHK